MPVAGHDAVVQPHEVGAVQHVALGDGLARGEAVEDGAVPMRDVVAPLLRQGLAEVPVAVQGLQLLLAAAVVVPAAPQQGDEVLHGQLGLHAGPRRHGAAAAAERPGAGNEHGEPRRDRGRHANAVFAYLIEGA